MPVAVAVASPALRGDAVNGWLAEEGRFTVSGFGGTRGLGFGSLGGWGKLANHMTTGGKIFTDSIVSSFFKMRYLTGSCPIARKKTRPIEPLKKKSISR